jgi:hypothetical protein
VTTCRLASAPPINNGHRRSTQRREPQQGFLSGQRGYAAGDPVGVELDLDLVQLLAKS